MDDENHISKNLFIVLQNRLMPLVLMCRLYYPPLSLAKPCTKAPLKCKISYVSLLVRDAAVVRRQTLHKRATARKRLLLRAATRAFAKAKAKAKSVAKGPKKKQRTLLLYQMVIKAGLCCCHTTCWLAWWRLAMWTGCGWAVIFEDAKPREAMLSVGIKF